VGADVVVEEELRENVEFLGQELVREVDCGVEDAQAVLQRSRRERNIEIEREGEGEVRRETRRREARRREARREKRRGEARREKRGEMARAGQRTWRMEAAMDWILIVLRCLDALSGRNSTNCCMFML
jgi:hypothetical protein